MAEIKKRDIPHNEDIAKNFMKNKGGAGGLHDFLGFKIVESTPGATHAIR